MTVRLKLAKKVFADESVTAVVELYRSLKIIYLSGFAEDLAYDPATLRIVFVHGVELLACYVSLMLYVFKLLLSWVKHFPCENLFFFGHDFLLVLFMIHKIMSDHNLAVFSAGRPHQRGSRSFNFAV